MGGHLVEYHRQGRSIFLVGPVNGRLTGFIYITMHLVVVCTEFLRKCLEWYHAIVKNMRSVSNSI